MKKFFVFLLTVMLMFSGSSFPVSAAGETERYMPRLNIINKDIPTIEAGKVAEIKFTVKNSSGYSAYNILITPEFGKPEDNPFTFEDLVFNKNIDSLLGNNSADVSFKIRVNSDAAEKNYPITIKYEFTNAYGDSKTESETIYVKVRNTNTPARLVVDKIETDPGNITAGQTFTAYFYIRNKGNVEARDVKYTLEGLGGSFTIASGSNINYFGAISGEGYTYVKYHLKAASNISNGTHPLKLKMNYKDPQNKPIEETHEVYLNVGGSGGLYDLKVQNISYPTNGVSTNQDINIGFDLKNEGKGKISNVKVTLDSADEAVVPKSTKIQKVANLEPGKSVRLNYVFFATSEAKTKNYPISITVEFDDANDVKDAKEGAVATSNNKIVQYIGMLVNGGDSSKSVPKLIIDKYNFEPKIVRAGQDFDVNLSFFNTNASKKVKNIKMFLTVDEKTEQSGSVFSPVESSNTFYIDEIPPKGRVEKNLKMFTVPDAKPKTYTMTAKFEYEDENGEKYEATELIGVPVVQQTKLEIGNIELPPEGYVGQPIPVMAQFYNKGKATLTNVMIKLEGDFNKENGDYFLGDFNAGNSESYDGSIIPTKAGELKGTLVFSYDDSAGEQVEVKKDFSINVVDAPPMEPGMDNMPPEMNKGGKKGKLIWGAVIIIAAGAGFVFWKKNKKKKGMTLDE
ncbi:hypothetical protein KQI86_17310 [Clostridium sp. MSJ-11]|uniref:CARDB domain-containing protein n=1 Tax=Clostridium mobile TaxID=2841512 RepID=A0ABS6EMU9_9CLOT|nr:CARDB domain-containing protein [Clostridium mobile]MBU5486082.1 hypothetical protein [Clostridium mobile]